MLLLVEAVCRRRSLAAVPLDIWDTVKRGDVPGLMAKTYHLRQSSLQSFQSQVTSEMKKAGLFDQIPSKGWQIDWNIDSQPVLSREAYLKYLAPYVSKVGISNSRILKVQHPALLIRYRKPHSARSRILSLEVMEFIRRFFRHVLTTSESSQSLLVWPCFACFGLIPINRRRFLFLLPSFESASGALV